MNVIQVYEFASEVVLITLQFMDYKKIRLTDYGMKEFVRYNMCVTLGLQTASPKGNMHTEEIVPVYKKLMKKHKIGVLGKAKKQGLLEACVHAVEIFLKEESYDE